MGRFLVLLILIALAVVVWRLLRKALAVPPAAPPSFEPTARCAQCGTHVPRDQLGVGGLCPKCSLQIP